jgi:hypothetical protein
MPIIIDKVHPNIKNFNPSAGFDGKAFYFQVKNAEQLKEISIHEFQHWLQKQNDFARGSNPDIAGKTKYRQSAGENEANSAMYRREMSNRERQQQHPSLNEIIPETGERMPRSQQDVRMSDDLRAAGYEASATLPHAKGRELDRKINTIQKRIDKLQDDLKAGNARFTPSAIEGKRTNLMQQTDSLRKLLDQKEALNLPDVPPPSYEVGKVNILTPVLKEIEQGVPKTLSDDIGKMAKRRSKLERLREEAQSQQTIIDNETRQPRVDRARKHLKSIEGQISKLVGE